MKDFYDGKRWQMLRQSILRRDGYMCQECKRYGKHIEGQHVHHILPREDFPQYQYSTWNLTTLCTNCHNKMHNRTDKTLTNKGKELVRRVCRAQNIDVETLMRCGGE